MNDPPGEKGFHDSTTYSELDRDDTILRTVDQLLTANDFYRDISAIVEDNSEDSIDMSHALIDDTVL